MIRSRLRLFQAALWVPLAYLGVVTVAGARRPASQPVRAGTRRFVVVVPAHNEEAGIVRTVHSLLATEYPEPLRRVVVIADNSTDATADAARAAGAEVWERDEPARAGKGAALGWALERLLDEPGWDVAAIVDADTVVDAAFLAVADDALSDGALVVQGLYRVGNPADSLVARLADVSFAAQSVLRPLGRTRLGGAAKLQGNGMVFDRRVLASVPWTAEGLAEDVEYWVELLLAGVRPVFEPAAVVAGAMPTYLAAARVQRARWEAGRAAAARRYLVPGLRHSVARRDLVLAEALVSEFVVPPLSTLAALAAVAASVRWLRERRGLGIGAAQAGVLAAHAVLALRVAGAPRASYVALLLAPAVVVWKLSVKLETIVTRRAEWRATPRGR